MPLAFSSTFNLVFHSQTVFYGHFYWNHNYWSLDFDFMLQKNIIDLLLCYNPICEMYIFLLEIEHSYYELLFVTSLIFYFLHLWVYYAAKKLESPEEEQVNNSDHSIPNSITREMLQWRFIESGLYEFYDIDTARNSVLSQPPCYDEVMKKDSKVMINMESDTEPPSYSEALRGENII